MTAYYYHQTDQRGVDVTAQVEELGADAEAEVAQLARIYDAVIYFDLEVDAPVGICVHCERAVIEFEGRWVDPEADGDDSVWRETCERHDTFTAEHEVES